MGKMSLALPLLLISYGLLPLAGSLILLVVVLGILGLGLGIVTSGFTGRASLAGGPDEQGTGHVDQGEE